MPAVEKRIVVRAPMDQVFAAVTDPRQAAEWNPHVIEVADFSGYPLGVGSHWRQTAGMAGQNLTVTCTIVTFNPPHEGVLELSGEQQGRMITRCRDVGGGTEVMQRLEYVLPGGLKGKMMNAVVQPMMDREIGQSLERIRAAFESGVGGTHGSGTA